MRSYSYPKTLAVLLVAIISFMYQETAAQPKKGKGQKTKVVEVKPVSPEISYTVSMSKPWTHLLEVEMRLKWEQMPEKAEIIMPVWTPGSYLVREYSRHVQDFTAKDASGNPLSWQKANKNTWQIDAKGLKELVVAYRVYSNELTVRTNELNDDHAFWNNGALLMYPKGQLAAASTIKVNPYRNWKIATGLPKFEGSNNTFRAENFDILFDSPFEVSDFKEMTFEVQGIKHRFVINGEGNYDLARVTADTKKIVEEGVKMFGDVPYKDYTFILNLRGGGGLEHLNSTALQWNRLGFKPEARYRDFLLLVAHEYFHVWNVKRIKPDALGPFDYNNENYTKLLWVAEGGTAYYEAVLVMRAGLMSDRDFLEARADQIKALQSRPGRFQTSLEEASFDAWIKYYRQDENAINNQISYYDKGEVVNFLLDLEIRRASGGLRSLDDVMRHLYNEFAKKGKNYTPADFQKTAELVAGKSLDEFFSKYVRGREELDYDASLSALGLRLVASAGKDAAIVTSETGQGQRQFWAQIGIETRQNSERFEVTSVRAGTTGYDGGLNTGDQIVAVDGTRATTSFLQGYLSEKKTGDKIKLTLFRFDDLREFEVVIGAKAPQSYVISQSAQPTEEQTTLYRGFFGTK